jgi:hypothetical protein
MNGNSDARSIPEAPMSTGDDSSASPPPQLDWRAELEAARCTPHREEVSLVSNTPVHPPITITGTIHVHVVPCEPLDAERAEELHLVLDRFIGALRLRMFPGALRAFHGITHRADAKVDAAFDVVELEVGALRVLHGMLAYFSVMVAPLATTMAWLDPVGSTPNLLDTDAPLPAHRSRLPFDATFTVGGGGVAPPLAVEVVFGRPVADEEKSRFDQELRVWASLLHGGYPEAGDLPGSSTIGPLTVRYDDPWTLRASTEGFFASDASFEPLKALVVGWVRTIPVVSLETE